jgi:hypothetical protein
MVCRVRASEVRVWVNYPAFVLALEAELNGVYEESAETFVSGNPNLTQEAKAKLIGREAMLLELLSMFKDGRIEMFFNPRNGFEVLEDEPQVVTEEAIDGE